jgi:hypothetical protein
MLWEQAAELKEYPALREVQFFANHDDSSLLVELFIHHTIAPSSLSKVARLLRREMPEIAGVAIFASGGTEGDLEDGSIESSRRLSRAGVPHVEGSPSMIYKVGSYEYKVSVGAFFQTNRFLAEKLVELVTRNRSGHGALDLFAGAGLFTLPLARIFERVTAVEVAPQSFANLKENAPPHIRPINSTTEDYLKAARGAGTMWWSTRHVQDWASGYLGCWLACVYRGSLMFPAIRRRSRVTWRCCSQKGIAWKRLTWWTSSRRRITWKAYSTWRVRPGIQEEKTKCTH